MVEIGQLQRLPAPEGVSRIETGAVQFGDDWPGLFIRGDNAFHLMLCVRRLAHLLEDHPNAEVVLNLGQVRSYTDSIERDVVVRRAADTEGRRGADNEKLG